jgi:hypothetical protein
MWQKISWTDGRTDRGKTVYPPPVERGYNNTEVYFAPLFVLRVHNSRIKSLKLNQPQVNRTCFFIYYFFNFNKSELAKHPPMPRLLCKFKYWNYSVITSVRSVKKAYHISDFSLTVTIQKPKIHHIWSTKRGITLVKLSKIVIIKLELDCYKIHLHTTSSFNLTFHSQVIRKLKVLQIYSTKRGITLIRIVEKSSLSNST